MRVLVAMSGGVDSSVAAARLVAEGHDVVGATLKLWGGPQSSGCCSVADVDDARRVAQQLGIPHHVFNLTEEFERDVVTPYVAAHAEGRTPNPCIECNRHIKFDRLLARARRLGFARLATGHHAQVREGGGRVSLRRGTDPLKDQSYVLSMLGQSQLRAIVLPVGTMTKEQVRAEARRLGLRTAGKPDSQDVCFIYEGAGARGAGGGRTAGRSAPSAGLGAPGSGLGAPGSGLGAPGSGGRAAFLSSRLELHAAKVVDEDTGAEVGTVDAVELVTVGQRRGMPASATRRYAIAVDVPGRRVTVADAARALVDEVTLEPGSLTWVDRPLHDGATAIAQVSAHGRPVPCTYRAVPSGGEGGVAGATCVFAVAQRPVAPGQTLAFYDADDPDEVRGAGIVAGSRRAR
jgi:tRNA-specific 2-thiouridylase